MLREIFVVKNTTTNDIELKDFGIIIPSGQTAELAEYDRAIMSDELYNYLSGGTLVRYIDGSSVTNPQIIYSTSNNYYLSDEQYGNIITVAITGSSYNTINSALNSITGNTPDNRFLIQVSPDLFVENITMKPFVTIQGASTYTRIQGKITINFTGSTNSSVLENIEVINYEEEAFDIDTDGIITINSISAKSTYTLPSVNRVKSVFNVKRGFVNFIGESTATYTNTNTGTANNIDTIFYVSGTGTTTLVSFNTSHKIITHEKNTFVSVVYNENINTATDISIKTTYDYFNLYNSIPNNLVSPIIHSGATNNTEFSSSRVLLQSQNVGTTKFMTAYNTNSLLVTSNIYNYFNSYSWDTMKINDSDVYLAAATTILDNVKIINCLFKTNSDVIPKRYKIDGSVGSVSYSLTNASGTQSNCGQIRLNSLFIGTSDTYNSGSTIINKILNENDLSSDSVTALPTQHSVKHYVDNAISGVTPTVYVTRTEFRSYTGTTGLQEITQIHPTTTIESSFRGGLVVERIRPIEDTATAIQINKADGSPIVNFDTNSGFTGHGTVNPKSLVHLYGFDNSDDDPLGLQTNAIRLDGGVDTDKDVVWSDNGVPKWMLETYRNENARFWYVYNQSSDTTPIVVSETGRMGINSPSNILEHYATKIIGTKQDDMFVTGTFDKGFIIVYQVQINNVTGTTDTFNWRSSKDQGITFTDWSSSIECSFTPTFIDSGINVQFSVITGHTIGDTFQFIAYPQLPQGTLVLYNRGLDYILKTEDYTADVVNYSILTDELNTSNSNIISTLFDTGTTDNALYLGLRVKFDEVFFGLVTNGVGLTLVTEYWDGFIWHDISIGSAFYNDATFSLTKTGSISWDSSTLTDWTETNIKDYTDDDSHLFWIRFRTVSSPTISPTSKLISLGGTKRFSIFSAPYDINPNFYVDTLGRVSIGGGNISGKNMLQINPDKYVDILSGADNSLFEVDSNDSSTGDIRIRLSSDDSLSGGITIAKTRGTLSSPTSILAGDEVGHLIMRGRLLNQGYNFTKISTIYTGNGESLQGDLVISTMNSVLSEKVRITSSGYTGFGIIPTAYVHIRSGNTTAAPLKFTSGALLTTTEIGSIEYNGNSWYGTINDGVRRRFAFLESPTFMGNPEFPSGTTIMGTNLHDFILTSGGSNSTLFVHRSDFTSYTGITQSTISDITTDITELSGWTGSKLDSTTFNEYTGSTLSWTQVNKSGSSISDLENRNASEVLYNEPHWNVTTAGEALDSITDYIENSQGSGRLTPETVLSGSTTYPWNLLHIVGGTGYITYTGFHKYITWTGQTIDLTGWAEGTYYVYVDIYENINIVTSEVDNVHNIRLGSFYWVGNAIATIQQCGCMMLNSEAKLAEYAIRQGVFIYDNGGAIQISGNTLKIISTPCKVQFGLLSQQLTEITSDDTATYKFMNTYISNDEGWELVYRFSTTDGSIPHTRWNNITKNSYVPITGVTVSFTNGSKNVTSTTNLTGSTYDLLNSFIYLESDGNEYAQPVDYVEWTGSQTNITLRSEYAGSTASGIMIANYALPQLPIGKYAKHLIIRTTDDQMYIILAQTYYDSENEALEGVLPFVHESVSNAGIKMASIVVDPNMTSLEGRITDLRPLPYQHRLGGQAGGGSIISSHSQLTGLNADDHTQYLRTDGTRSLTGIQHYQTHPIFSTNTDIVDKKYVDDKDVLKLNISDFNVFTGTTLPSLYVGLSTYNSYTETTNNTISSLSGWTGTKLDISIFDTYSAITIPSTYLTINKFNIYSGNTLTILAGKQSTITGAAITITGDTLTTNRVLVSDASGNVVVSNTTSTQIDYLSGLTSDVQSQINLKSPLNSPTFTGIPSAPTANVNTNTSQIATTSYVVGQASTVGPLMNGMTTIGTSLSYSREDHIHPSDTSRLSLSGGTLSGSLTINANLNVTGNTFVTGSTYLYNTTEGPSTKQYSVQIDSMNNKISIDTGITATYYGQNFHYTQDLITTSTTIKIPTYAVKTGITTTILPIGTYRITYSCGINKSDNKSDMITRLIVDGVTLGGVQNYKLFDASTWLYVTRMMFITFETASTHTLNLEFTQENNGTVSIRDASIELIRVS